MITLTFGSHRAAGIRQPHRNSHTVEQYSRERLDEDTSGSRGQHAPPQAAVCAVGGARARIQRVQASTMYSSAGTGLVPGTMHLSEQRLTQLPLPWSGRTAWPRFKLGRPHECGAQSHRSATMHGHGGCMRIDNIHAVYTCMQGSISSAPSLRIIANYYCYDTCMLRQAVQFLVLEVLSQKSNFSSSSYILL